MTEDEMVGWHHRFDGHEFEQALGVGDGQGSLVCCSPWKNHTTGKTKTIGKTIALTRRTFLGKVMSLLFNMLSRLIIVFLPRSKSLLISWLQSPCAVILEPPKIKSVIDSIVFPSICCEVMKPLYKDLNFPKA